MGQYSVEKREYTPVNFLAGDFPTVTGTKVAAEEIKERTPVVLDESGKLAAVTAQTIQKLTGIAAMSVAEDEPCVYYQTGEFFTDALNLPNGVTADAIEETLRNKMIFLR